MKISTQSAEHYNWGSACDGWHLVKQPELSVIEERMPPGTPEVRHYHREARQFFYVLQGTAELEADGTVHILNAGEGCEIPPHMPHQMRNTSGQDVKFLVISHPQTRGDRVEAP